MKKNVIHRDSNYMVFISGLNTSATNAGERYEAMKGDNNGWHIYDNYTGKLYAAPLATLRAIINNGGEIVAQTRTNYTLSQRVQFNLY